MLLGFHTDTFLYSFTLFDSIEKMKKQWTYKNAKFEYHKKIYDYHLPWAGHTFFAYDLICNLKPKVVVELGTYRGTSFFSFCQAVKDCKFSTRLFAIDSWEGEDHTGMYGKDILKEVKSIVDKYYQKLNVKLLKTYFDSAINKFMDNQIDILHIDGLHTYEAVRHDYETWQGKVSKNGVILFHDINVQERGFGVHAFWKELKKSENTIEFHHSQGLGVVVRNTQMHHMLKKMEKIFQRKYEKIFQKTQMIESQNKENLVLYIKELENMVVQSKKDLEKIQSAKAYKLWQKYNDIKKKIRISIS